MVEIESQKAGPSDRRSLGSNRYPSSRFPKVSIGITVEKCPKLGPRTKRENGISLPTGEGVPSSQGKILEVNRGSVIVETSGGKQPIKDQNAAEWISSRSVHHEKPIVETVKVYANRASMLQSEDHVHKISDTFAFGKRTEKVGNVERVEEVAFSVMQEMHVQDKGAGEEQPEGTPRHNNEALRMKLWEILGTASQHKQVLNSPDLENAETLNIRQTASQNKQNVTSPDLESTKTFNMEQKQRCHSGKVPQVAKPKQNSDTIETDSESPNQTVRRPITRSLTRKRAPSTMTYKVRGDSKYGKMPLSSSSSGSKLKFEEKSIFAFDEEERKAGRLDQIINGHSNRSKGKRSEQQKGKIEPRRTYFPQFAPDSSFRTNEREQTRPSPNKASQECKKNGYAPFLLYQGEKDILLPSVEVPNASCHSKVEVQKRSAYQTACNAGAHEYFGSPLLKKKTHSCEQTKIPPEPKNAYHDSVASPLGEGDKYPFDNFQSPTLAINRPSKSLDKPSSGSYGSESSDADTEYSSDTREILESQDLGSPVVEEVKETEKQPSLSPIEDPETQIFEANDYLVKGYRRRDKWFSDASSLEKSPVAFHCKKRIRSLEEGRRSNKTLSPQSPVGNSRTEEATVLLETLEKHPEDSLARAICQLALVLRKFKTKIKLQRSKKSSEILSTAAENIHLLLQDAESRIEADVGKFISTGKTKRKHLESRFQEQQETLKFIHDKFKEEINQHVLDCRSTLEELEAHQIELKGSVDRQKASHRKLLQEVEESMDAQLNDAEARIAAIHQETQKKMTGLKLVLKEWLKDGMTT